MKPKDKNFNLRAAPYPTGSAGKPFTNNIRAVRYVEGGGTAVSSKNKHQKEAIKWLDYAYSEEGSLLFNWGIEGKSYVIENGKPKFTDIVVKDPKGLPVSQAIVRYSAASVATPRLFDLDAKAIIRSSWPEQSEAMEVWAKADTSLLLPDITPTVEESNRLARIMGEINTYNDEMFNKFIMGQESIENFDKYVSTLKGMGIDEALQIQQAALDRYNSRK
jgi:putative aldouronate transport system substrate-binding protein